MDIRDGSMPARLPPLRPMKSAPLHGWFIVMLHNGTTYRAKLLLHPDSSAPRRVDIRTAPHPCHPDVPPDLSAGFDDCRGWWPLPEVLEE